MRERGARHGRSFTLRRTRVATDLLALVLGVAVAAAGFLMREFAWIWAA